MLRKLAGRLAQGFSIPGANVDVSINVTRSRRQKGAVENIPAERAIEHAILLRHIDTLIARCPPLGTFRHDAILSNYKETVAFLNFCNDGVSIFDARAREVQVRRCLVRLLADVSSTSFRDHILDRIAESDLSSGVVDRALRLRRDARFSDRVESEMQKYDAHYAANSGFLACIDKMSLEGDARGRTLVAFFQKNLPLIRGKRLLHIAPERDLKDFFQSRNAELALTYETLDGFSSGGTYQADIAAMPIPDSAFDVVICHRVLEHVIGDVAALAEINRILVPGGLLNVSVPQSMNLAESNEWLACDSSHHDHVRQYGRDFQNRLENAGFHVEVDKSLLDASPADHHEAQTFPLRHYLCRKIAA